MLHSTYDSVTTLCELASFSMRMFKKWVCDCSRCVLKNENDLNIYRLVGIQLEWRAEFPLNEFTDFDVIFTFEISFPCQNIHFHCSNTKIIHFQKMFKNCLSVCSVPFCRFGCVLRYLLFLFRMVLVNRKISLNVTRYM